MSTFFSLCDLKVINLFHFPPSETKAAMNLFRKDAISTKNEKEKEIQYEDPPDGGWGWMVVIHCFLVCPAQVLEDMMVAYPIITLVCRM